VLGRSPVDRLANPCSSRPQPSDRAARLRSRTVLRACMVTSSCVPFQLGNRPGLPRGDLAAGSR
jgi:hypothetical protein